MLNQEGVRWAGEGVEAFDMRGGKVVEGDVSDAGCGIDYPHRDGSTRRWYMEIWRCNCHCHGERETMPDLGTAIVQRSQLLAPGEVRSVLVRVGLGPVQFKSNQSLYLN